MSIAVISPRSARVLMRVRWLAWGAIVALMATHLAASLAPSPPFHAVPAADIAAAAGSVFG